MECAVALLLVVALPLALFGAELSFVAVLLVAYAALIILAGIICLLALAISRTIVVFRAAFADPMTGPLVADMVNATIGLPVLYISAYLGAHWHHN